MHPELLASLSLLSSTLTSLTIFKLDPGLGRVFSTFTALTFLAIPIRQVSDFTSPLPAGGGDARDGIDALLDAFTRPVPELAVTMRFTTVLPETVLVVVRKRKSWDGLAEAHLPGVLEEELRGEESGEAFLKVCREKGIYLMFKEA